MMGIIYSTLDETSANIAEHMLGAYEFEETEENVFVSTENRNVALFRLNSPLHTAELIDSFNLEYAYLLSRHASKAGVEALTTHSTGNWGKDAVLGGKPGQLSCAAPVEMLSILTALCNTGLPTDKTYEATHHGPLLRTPSLFIEIGGTDRVTANKETAARVGDVVFETANRRERYTEEFGKVVIGIGGTHYSSKFSQLAIGKGYAFSHIMPKYAIKDEDGTYNVSVLEQTLTRTSHKPEAAVIEWKSLNEELREHVIKELDNMGLDYEKA